MGAAQEPRSGCPINATIEVFGDRWSLLVLPRCYQLLVAARQPAMSKGAAHGGAGPLDRRGGRLMAGGAHHRGDLAVTPPRPVGRVLRRQASAASTAGVGHGPFTGASPLGWESGIGTTGQYPRQDLIPGNMDDGFHLRDDEAVLGVRATRVSGWEAK